MTSLGKEEHREAAIVAVKRRLIVLANALLRDRRVWTETPPTRRLLAAADLRTGAFLLPSAAGHFDASEAEAKLWKTSGQPVDVDYGPWENRQKSLNRQHGCFRSYPGPHKTISRRRLHPQPYALGIISIHAVIEQTFEGTIRLL